MTPRPVLPSAPAAAATVERNNTTIASVGTAVNLHSFTMNVRAGYQLWLPPECWWGTGGTALLVVRLLAAPTDSVTMGGTIYFMED